MKFCKRGEISPNLVTLLMWADIKMAPKLWLLWTKNCGSISRLFFLMVECTVKQLPFKKVDKFLLCNTLIRRSHRATGYVYPIWWRAMHIHNKKWKSTWPVSWRRRSWTLLLLKLFWWNQCDQMLQIKLAQIFFKCCPKSKVHLHYDKNAAFLR